MQSAEYFIAAIGYRPYSGARCLAEGMIMADGPSPSSRTDSSASSEIRIANRIAEMTQVAELVDSFGAHHGLSNDVVVALNVSLDEILNNIISYGYDDAGGHDIALKRQDGSGILRVDIARGKAWGALGMGFSSREIAERAQKVPAFIGALSAVSQVRLSAFR